MATRSISFGAPAVLALLLVLLTPAETSRGAEPEAAGETIIVRFSDMPGAASGAATSLAEEGYVRLDVPEGQDAQSFAASLKGAPGIASAQADAPVFATAAPNDPFYVSAQDPYLSTLDVEGAWDLATGSNTVVVAVIDSGTDVAHEDLSGRLWENRLDANSNGIDDDGNGCIDDRYGCRFISNLTAARQAQCGYDTTAPTGAILDDHGAPGSDNHSHGTLVAGMIGAAGNNGVGITGVAWNVQIMTLKVLDCGTSLGSPSGEMSDVALAIDYARRMGADIINLSLASRPADNSADLDVLRSAIEAAQTQGIIIVAAAGNWGTQGVGFPAAYTQYNNVIGVGAADNTQGGVWASYSSVGDGVDFAAPGNDIVGTTRSDRGEALPYGVETGTSFSAPLVSGMFALMKSRNSVLGHEDLIQFARDAATPGSTTGQSGNWAGAGTINIGEAVARVPMSINGDALKDWLYLEPGVRIRAFIGSTECGTATTDGAFAPVIRFSIRVASDEQQSGCGQPGKTVRFLVGGDQAQTELAWGEQNEDLALLNRDLVVVSPPPGPIVVQRGTSGWSLAAHFPGGGAMPAAVSYLTASWTEIHAWQGGADGNPFDSFVSGIPQYANSLNSIEQFDVYWVNGTQSIIPTPKPALTPGKVIFLQNGWNAFVFSGESREVSDALAEIEGSYEQVLRYDNQTETWLSYIPGQPRYFQDFGGLMELQIYWVYISEAGDKFFTIE
jgi:Subtilase family